MLEKQFCAQISRDTDDPFRGTAPRIDIWLLIEYAGAWGRDEIQDSNLPVEVKSWLEAIQTRHVRTQLIKRNRQRSEDITIYVSITQEQRQALYQFHMERYEDVLALDLEALREGHNRYEQYRYYDPLFLVCTHGKHDACCAKFGLPVYNEMERLADAFSWQCSHVGGDKFAANVLCFPHGIYYGRVTEPEVKIIIASYWQLQLHLHKYRGRTCYQPVVQAADYFLRERTGETDLRAFRLIGARQATGDCWWINFKQIHNGIQYCLLVQEQTSETRSYQTICHAEGKNVNKLYNLRSYEQLESGNVFTFTNLASLSGT